jgi:hypothetical protein
VKGFEVELGLFSLEEMAAIKVMGLGIERDLYWTPRRLSEVIHIWEQNHHIRCRVG